MPGHDALRSAALRVCAPDARPAPHDPVTDAWDALDVPVAVFDVAGTALRWAAANAAQGALLGCDFAALRGRGLDVHSPVAVERWAAAITPELLALTARATFEPAHPDADTGRWTARTVTPTFDADGALHRLVVTSADVTEGHRLAAMVAHGARADAVGRIADEAAHEFNNLMVAISGYAGLALRGAGVEGRVRDQLVEMLRLADTASSLTRQLMALTRRHEGARSLVRLDALVLGMERVLLRATRDRRALTVRGDAGLWPVKVDAEQFEQLALHLAVYAADVTALPSMAFEAHNVTLSRDEARPLGLGAGDHVRLSLSLGAVDAASVRRAVETVTATAATRSDTEIGIAAAAGIARRHGAALSLDVSEGVSLCVHVPRALEKSVVSGVTMASAGLQGTETVLVVDPDARREAIARTLRMLGYTVLEALDAVDAQAAVEERAEPVHLVILGVGPGRPDAMSLLRAVRVRAGDVPVLVTAPDETSVMPLALVSPRVLKLPTTLSPTQLARRVRTALDERAHGA